MRTQTDLHEYQQKAVNFQSTHKESALFCVIMVCVRIGEMS
jgi:cell fate (sporulation/competence/biofilm development) regulator YmcA (YheA/YmcA/DUF963 family)